MFTMTGDRGGRGRNNSGSSFQILEAHTATSSTELDFNNWYSSAYDEYVIELLALVPSGAATFGLQVSVNGGNTYDSTSGHYSNAVFRYNSGATAVGDATTTQINLSASVDSVTTSASYGMTGQLRLYAPGGTTPFPRFMGQLGYQTSGGTVFQGVLIHAVYSGAVRAVNAFRIFPASGNISSGTARIYGVGH